MVNCITILLALVQVAIPDLIILLVLGCLGREFLQLCVSMGFSHEIIGSISKYAFSGFMWR